MTKFTLFSILVSAYVFMPGSLLSQDQIVHPAFISTGTFLGISPPLRDLPRMTNADWEAMKEKAEKDELNEELSTRFYPNAANALPKGPDPVWQKQMGHTRENHAPVVDFQGQNSPYFPPDANGSVGPNHYMQTINTVYSIYDKAGTLLAGPTNMNLLFTGVNGSENNDGDPIVLYDDQADRWLTAEFSISGNNDSMMVAISTTSDPTGTWYKYSFDVADLPDYPKFGIWRDGYYMGTNNSNGNDIYVFERSQMLMGGTAHVVAFDNPNRPSSIDGFMCVPPVDNDGAFASIGSPGLFIAFNDDAIGGGSDQLWIYALHVDWNILVNSTFSRIQQINVAAFDSNFGTNWDNITQLGTTQKLDAIPQVIMNVPQYRNFGSYETIVCCHTVDVDATNHAGIRWYELRRTGANWSIRQQGTYAPDVNSRWLGSISLNGSNEIALGYSVSSSTLNPGIRYTGQSAAAYAAGSSTLDIPEDVILNGTFSQTGQNRWGDYSAMQVDPVNDEAFWFTTEYIGSGNARKTQIASFQIGPEIMFAEFTADDFHPLVDSLVSFTDASSGNPITWNWIVSPSSYVFANGTSSSSQNPQIKFTAQGFYTIKLIVSNGVTNDTLTKTNYIQAIHCDEASMPFSEDFSDGSLPGCWTMIDHIGNGQVWQFNNPGARTINTVTSANGFAILDSDHYGSGNSQNADLVTPTFDFHYYSTVHLSFDHYFLAYTGSSAKLSYSTDGGNSWTVIKTWTATTANAETFNQDLNFEVAGKSNVKFKWNYTGSYGYYWAVDDISITGTGPAIWTGTNSSSWNVTGNWLNNNLPGSTKNVIIPDSVLHWPEVSGDLSLGNMCRNLDLLGSSQLTIDGNLNIESGFIFSVLDSGLVHIGQDFRKIGGFDPGNGTVEFFTSSADTAHSEAIQDITMVQYTREAFPQGLTFLTGASAGPTGDNGYSDVSLGFTFYFAGVGYNQARISTNGWVSLNQSGTTTAANANLFTTSIPNTTLAPWFDDLSADGTSSIQYKISGSAPNRIFTVEWKDVLTYRTGATARINFQLKLYETSNQVEFHYGNLQSGTHSNSESASIGMEDAIGGVGHFMDATTGSFTTGITTLKSLTNWPVLNYRFNAPELDLYFHNIIMNNAGGNVVFDANTQVSGKIHSMPGGAFSISTGNILHIQ